MIRLFRELEQGEFFVVFGDCAQGGSDKNYVQFMSKKHADVPLVISFNGVGTELTPILREALHYVFNKTGVVPTVAVERQMGGASIMHDLHASNTEGKYRIYFAKSFGKENGEIETDKLGWDTNAMTRPKMLGEWLIAYNSKLIKLYDKETQEQHQTFIVNKNGRPEAAQGTHDDAVMSLAGAYQLYQSENPYVIPKRTRAPRPRSRLHV